MVARIFKIIVIIMIALIMLYLWSGLQLRHRKGCL